MQLISFVGCVNLSEKIMNQVIIGLADSNKMIVKYIIDRLNKAGMMLTGQRCCSAAGPGDKDGTFYKN